MTTRSGRGRLLASNAKMALGDLTNVAERQQGGKAATGIKNLITEAVGAIAGAGKRKRSLAAVVDEVENERAARPAKAGRVGSGSKSARPQRAFPEPLGAPSGCLTRLARPTGEEPVGRVLPQALGSPRLRR